MLQEDDQYASVAWETTPDDSNSAYTHSQPSIPDHNRTASTSSHTRQPSVSDRNLASFVTNVQVKDAKTELEGTKDTFVSYAVAAKTTLSTFASKEPTARRRFQDFHFLRENLQKDFPAAVVPPLPDKHRMEYLTGDRFSTEFIERRRMDLQRFLERVARHPKLSRTSLFQNFLESTEWSVFKHKHTAHPADPDPPSGILDNISDTLLNAFTKVRKPDERFVEMKHHLDQFEEGLVSIERLGARSRTRLSDLSGDYEDLAASVQGLGYLESGITDQLARFERALNEFGNAVKDNSGGTTDPFLEHLHALLAYSAAFKSVLKLRDQKQLDFEELSSYLSNVVTERDRLAGGYGYGMGIGSYFKEKVESFRGGDGDLTREGKLARLDTKIKELSDAVIASQDTSQAFNDEVMNEYHIWVLVKRLEMKELLSSFADGQMALYQHSIKTWDKTITRIGTDPQ
ncbi:hypothetical protein T439DRAFT_323887 [Meredithblackwellia eburnea MCA 4105]